MALHFVKPKKTTTMDENVQKTTTMDENIEVVVFQIQNRVLSQRTYKNLCSLNIVVEQKKHKKGRTKHLSKVKKRNFFGTEKAWVPEKLFPPLRSWRSCSPSGRVAPEKFFWNTTVFLFQKRFRFLLWQLFTPNLLKWHYFISRPPKRALFGGLYFFHRVTLKLS